MILDFLISPAYAQSAPTTGSSDLFSFLPLVAIFVIFYFLMLRPQQKRAKETKAMLEALQKGDEVVTVGGIVGRIAKLTEQYVTVEIATGVEVNLQRQAVATVLPKGSLKNI